MPRVTHEVTPSRGYRLIPVEMMHGDLVDSNGNGLVANRLPDMLESLTKEIERKLSDRGQQLARPIAFSVRLEAWADGISTEAEMQGFLPDNVTAIVTGRDDEPYDVNGTKS